MPANTEPLHEASDSHNYYYRRPLAGTELLPAIAIGIGAGIAAFYVARLLTQRTPLIDQGSHGADVRRRLRGDGDVG